jgi:predicted lipoprotein with Yx(FWY)xxD motif
MRRTFLFALGLAVSLATIGPALALDSPTAIQTNDTAIGAVLTDNSGMTLYTFDEDSVGGSSCYGRCAENWPPLEAGTTTGPIGEFSIIMREDGVAQWAYKGKALYNWVRDKAPGDTTGDGVRGWHAARP